MKESRDTSSLYEGKKTSWYENGQKWEEGRYKKEKKKGEWDMWDKDGQIIIVNIFKAGQKVNCANYRIFILNPNRIDFFL